MVFITTLKIFEAYRSYGFFPMVIYGKMGIGKSSFAIKLLAEVYGKWEDGKLVELNWNAWKKWMVFLPDEFVKKVDEIQNKGERSYLLVWDDAGLWASSYSYFDKIAIAIGDYLNVARTDLASIVFTTPNPSWLMKRIREIPGIYFSKVVNHKRGYDNASHKSKRWFLAYRIWKDFLNNKIGRILEYYDIFNVKLPDNVFKEYDKVRRKYTIIAKKRLEEILEEYGDNHPKKKELLEKLQFLSYRK